MRPSTLALVTTAVLAISSFRCGAQMGSPNDGGTGAAATGGTGGANSGTGGATPVGTGGAAVTGSGGSARGTGGASTGTGGAVSTGGVDDGRLFTDAAVVGPGSGGTIGTDAAVPPRTDASADGPPGDGHVATASIPVVGLTAVFTQKGIDVTVVVTATKCPAGAHTIQIHDGFSCDSAATELGVWGGTRGAGIPSITCNAAMQGTLTYTRLGSNAATNWTIGDHNTLTDATLHPISLDTNCGTFF
jgi:hypothetical protein